jgi:predicted metal-binding protein
MLYISPVSESRAAHQEDKTDNILRCPDSFNIIMMEAKMEGSGLDKYREEALRSGVAEAKVIETGSVVTAPWVRLKCLFSCPGGGKSHCCPPQTPAADETRAILDSYSKAILFHLAVPAFGEEHQRLQEILVKMEGDMFKDGYYKAFVLLAGPCLLCKECASIQGVPCRLKTKARPSMEACGIDVFQTVRNNDFSIQTLREKTEKANIFCLMLVD